jgi:hypothetical protein
MYLLVGPSCLMDLLVVQLHCIDESNNHMTELVLIKAD